MSELGKEIMKAVPALELSTQDFILRSKNNPNPLPHSTALRLSVNLQQYFCPQLGRWTVALPRSPSTVTTSPTRRPSSMRPARYCWSHSAHLQGRRSFSALDLRKKDCWINEQQASSRMVPFIFLSTSPDLLLIIAPSARNPSRITWRSFLS